MCILDLKRRLFIFPVPLYYYYLNGSRQSRTATHETVSTGVSKKSRLFYASVL